MRLIDRFAEVCCGFAGSPIAFLLAVTILVVWALTGPFLHFSDFWQLTINTGTTISTFLLGFLIQNAVNRQAQRDRELAEQDANINELAKHELDEVLRRLGEQDEKILSALAEVQASVQRRARKQ